MMADQDERVRKVTKEVLDISKNAVLIGGLSHFAQVSGSGLLKWSAGLLFLVLMMHIQSYIQGKVFVGFLRDRLGLWGPAAWLLGLATAFLIAVALVMATDHAIQQIANAQAK